MKLLKAIGEFLIIKFDKNSNKTFFDTNLFGWVKDIEKDYMIIRKELDNILDYQNIPRYENIMDITKDSEIAKKWFPWKNYYLFCYGNRIDNNYNKFPKTIKLIKKIPGIKTAFFSVFEPNTHLTPHRGPYKGVLRYHLGLIIPKDKELCKIRINNDIRSWEEGKSIIFDDSHIHEAWNNSNERRVVLFVDFVRPLNFPLSLINNMIIRIAKNSKEVKNIVNNIKKYPV